LNFSNFSSIFDNLSIAAAFLSISALTKVSGAFLTNDSFNNFLSKIAIYSFVSAICSFNLSISFSMSSALDVST
jgi:hypothetical protein